VDRGKNLEYIFRLTMVIYFPNESDYVTALQNAESNPPDWAALRGQLLKPLEGQGPLRWQTALVTVATSNTPGPPEVPTRDLSAISSAESAGPGFRAGSGWPNLELFESEQAFVDRAGTSASAKQHVVRVHLDVSSPDSQAYEQLRTAWAAGNWFRVGLILSDWVFEMSLGKGRSPDEALALLHALPFPLPQRQPSNGALEYYLLTDFGAQTLHLFRFVMTVKVDQNDWSDLVHACANGERERYIETLKEALGGDLNDWNGGIVDASWPS
jgi:hypothetical protein